MRGDDLPVRLQLSELHHDSALVQLRLEALRAAARDVRTCDSQIVLRHKCFMFRPGAVENDA